MRDESGIALPLVMGLLVVLSLIGAGLLSQTITSTKFYESAGISYMGLWNEKGTGALQDKVTGALQNLDKAENVTNLLKGNLVTGIGKDQNDIITIMYAISSGNVWTPDWNQTFSAMSTRYNNAAGSVWTVNKLQPLQDSTITSTFFSTTNEKETRFLFNDSGQSACWNSYNLHVEFNVELSPKFGIYYNANTTGNDFFANLFLISLIDEEFSINKKNPGISSIPGQSPNPISFAQTPFQSWANASSLGTGKPFNAWHQIDISVQSQGKGSVMTTTVKVDNVVVLTVEDKVQNKFQPNMIGLSNWSANNWGTQNNPPSVTFRNVSVMSTTP